MSANLLLHLNLLLPALLGVLLRPQSTQILGLLGRIVTLTSLLLALTLIVIEALSVPRMELLARCFIRQVVQPRYLRCAKRPTGVATWAVGIDVLLRKALDILVLRHGDYLSVLAVEG